jgi:hypothetical protein
MIKQIVGGAITLVIGGTAYTISQADVTNNFSNNTGLTQQQAQQYINNIPQSEIVSFNKAGQDLIDDGNTVQNDATQIDCANYIYKWESPVLTCSDGQTQIQQISVDEITLGNCYQALDTDLGNSAQAKMNECISETDQVNSDFELPVALAILDNKTITDLTNTNNYNKSVLQAALQHK